MVSTIKCHIVSFALLLFSFQTYADEIPKELNNDKVRGEISKQIANLNISLGFEFFDISDTGYKASVGYKYGIEPSYQDGFFTRFDKYPGKIMINPLAWAFDESHFGLSISANAEIQFVRQFRDQKEAFTALPYSPFKSPTTAKKAIKELAVGDYASIIYRLNGFAGVGNGWNDLIKISASAGHSISAQYGAQVFRLRNNHIRLRLFAERSNGPGLYVNSKVDDDDFDLFSTEYLNDAILKLIKVDLFEMNIQSRKRALYLADFVVNLNNKEAQAAYDRILKKIVDIKDRKYRLLNPLEDEEEIISFLLDYTQELEQMYQEDQAQKANVRRVTRIFLGKDIIPFSSNNSIEIGNALLSFKKGSQFFDNRLTFLARNNDINRFNLPDATYFDEFKALFSLWQESISRSANALIKRSEQDEIEELIDFGFLFEYKDKRLYPSEIKALKNRICNILSAENCSQINWSEYQKERTNNFRMRAQYIFNQDAYLELAKLNYNDYYNKIIETLLLQDEDQVRRLETVNQLECIAENCDIFDLHRTNIKELAQKLYNTFHSQNLEEAYNAYTSMRWNSIFNNFGGQILMNMLPGSDKLEYGTIIIELTGSNREPVEVILTSQKDRNKENAKGRRALYDYVKNIQTSIFNRGFDLRLQGVYGDLEDLNP
ncbi:MAG: hypothetical protein KDD58_09730 [Bdellovibrionales bacterium]|nr:hypothetical protein [Bdellovibrionales bacterium]